MSSSSQKVVSLVVNAFRELYENMASDGNIPIDCPLPKFNAADVKTLCSTAAKVLASRPTLMRIPGDAYVVGDLHGNIHDLLRILGRIGNIANSKIVFLGDYVDRGQFSIEVIILLLALTCKYPDNVTLLRGNHEFSSVNEVYGFMDQVYEVYQSADLWKKFNEVFAFMPLAAVIGDSTFCVHGGFGPEFYSLDQIQEFQKPLVVCQDPMLFNLMWGDPDKDSPEFGPSKRGDGVCFGASALARFLKHNKLIRMVRAHQPVENGVEALFHDTLYTVFSSSNYGELPNNKGGFIKVSKGKVEENILNPYSRTITRAEVTFTEAKETVKAPTQPIGQLKMSMRTLSIEKLNQTASTGVKLGMTKTANGSGCQLKGREKKLSLLPKRL